MSAWPVAGPIGGPSRRCRRRSHIDSDQSACSQPSQSTSPPRTHRRRQQRNRAHDAFADSGESPQVGSNRRDGVAFTSDGSLDVDIAGRPNQTATGDAAKSTYVNEVLYADDIAMPFGRRAYLCHTAPLFFAHCKSCGLEAHRGTIQAPTSKTAAVYHPPHGRIQVLRGDRLLDPDEETEWVFYAYESRPKDDGPVGWYHGVDQIFDPNCPRRFHHFERSSRAEIGHWRLAWIAKHDVPDNVFNDDRSMVSADKDGGVFPVNSS